MTVGDALATTSDRLARAGVPSPDVDAELLIRHVTGWSRTRLVLDAQAPLSRAAAAQLEPVVRRRECREPLQLILGSVGFRYLDVEVRPGVFIPRPETEVLAGEAIQRVPQGGVVVEPCTGTGAIACSVALEAPVSQVVATDISSAAVDLAASNAARAGVDLRVVHGDLLAPVPQRLRGRVDVVVSNPPYLAAGELDAVEPEVARWDPVGALVAGPSGHEVTDQLIRESLAWLRPGGWLLLEVDASRAADVSARATAAGFQAARVLPDLTGADRIVAVRSPGSP